MSLLYQVFFNYLLSLQKKKKTKLQGQAPLSQTLLLSLMNVLDNFEESNSMLFTLPLFTPPQAPPGTVSPLTLSSESWSGTC